MKTLLWGHKVAKVPSFGDTKTMMTLDILMRQKLMVAQSSLCCLFAHRNAFWEEDRELLSYRPRPMTGNYRFIFNLKTGNKAASYYPSPPHNLDHIAIQITNQLNPVTVTGVTPAPQNTNQTHIALQLLSRTFWQGIH